MFGRKKEQTPPPQPIVVEDIEEEKEPSFRWKNRKYLKSPLPFESFVEETKIFSHNDTFDGFRFEVQKRIKESFALSHVWHLGSQTEPSSYFMGVQMHEETGAYYLQATRDTNRKVMGGFGLKPNKFIKFSTHIQSTPADSDTPSGVMAEVTMKPNKETMTQLKYQGGGWILDYSQSISESLNLGFQYSYYQPQQITQGPVLGFRYRGIRHKFGATFDPKYLSGTVSYGVNGTITGTSLFTELTGGMKSPTEYGVSSAVGFEKKFPHGSVKARLTDEGVVTSVYEQDLGQMKISWCADLDHGKSNYKFGLGVSLLFANF